MWVSVVLKFGSKTSFIKIYEIECKNIDGRKKGDRLK